MGPVRDGGLDNMLVTPFFLGAVYTAPAWELPDAPSVSSATLLRRWHTYQAWTDAGRTTVANTEGAKVYTLDDLSANAIHVTQSTEANRPVIKLDQLNGKAVMSFDGANDYLSAAGNITPKYAFIMCLGESGGAGNYRGILTTRSEAGGTAYIFDNASYGTFQWAGNGDLRFKTSGAGADISGGVTAFSFLDTWQLSEASSVNGAAFNDGVCIGQDRAYTGRNWDGYFAEMLVYDAILSHEDIMTVRQYFTSQYGIPYKGLDKWAGSAGQSITARNPEIGGTWSLLQGTFEIGSAANTMVPTSNNDNDIAVMETSTANVSVVIRTTPFDSGGAESNFMTVVRASDVNNFWASTLNSNTNYWKLYEVQAGVWTERLSWGPTTVDSGTLYQVVTHCYNNTISLCVASAAVFPQQYTSATFNNTATKHGLAINKTGSPATKATCQSFEVCKA